MITVIGIYGASGFGREVLPVIQRQLKTKTNYRFFFIDDSVKSQTKINGIKVINYEDFLRWESKKIITIAIADPKIRNKLANKALQDNISFLNVIDPTVLVFDKVTYGTGAVLCPHVQLTSNISIGVHFHANIYSYVAHDCVIGDYVTFAPRVSCNGNVIIEDHAYIGTGAMLRQGTPDKPLVIGKNAVVGMGAVVTKDVPPNTTVVGNPARPLVKT